MWPTATAESLGAKQRANPSPDYHAAGRRLIAGNTAFSTSYALSGKEKKARQRAAMTACRNFSARANY